MQEYKGLKVGDKVVVKNWSQFQPRISAIKSFDNQNKETKWEFDTGYIVLELDWSEYGFDKSKVSMHDENKTWYRFSSAN